MSEGANGMTNYDNFGEPWLLEHAPASGDAYDPSLDRDPAER